MTKGECIREAREAIGLTQQQLGERIGLKPNSAQPVVAGWERGDRPIPRRRVKEVADLLGLDIKDLI